MKHLKYLLMAALVAMPLTACDEDDGPIVEPTPTGTITGTVSAEGAGLSGVSVTMVGATTLSATTGANGAYTFTNVEAGSYGIAIDASNHPGVSFSVTSKTTSITSQGQTSTVDFSGSFIRTAAILGSVTASGAPLAGVSVAVTGGPDNVTNNSVTNAGGEFSATGLRAGTYSVAISNLPTGVTFTATTQSVTLATGESKTAHFPGQAVQLATISGAVTVDNVGTAGVAVALSGGATATTETGPGGAFSFTGLTPGAYTVTITPPTNTTFEAVAKNVTVNAGQTGVVNFAGKGPEVPATITIQSITKSGLSNPVDLTDVFGQIEVALNITEGSRGLRMVEVWIGDQVVAAQTLTPQPVVDEAELVTTQTIVLNVPTNQVRMGTDGYVPVVFNGQNIIAAKLYEVGEDPPIPSNNVPVVMNNPDVLLQGEFTHVHQDDVNCITVGGNVWCTGGAILGGYQYLSFSTVQPTVVRFANTGTAVCATPVTTFVGTPLTGLVVTNTYACAGVEGTVIPDMNGVPTVTYPAGSVGPDGSDLTAPTGFSRLGAPFTLDNENRWFLIPSAPTLTVPILRVDNKAPTVEVFGQTSSTLFVGVDPVSSLLVAYNRFFDEPWVNAEYEFIDAVVTSDGGVGVDVATTTTWEWPGTTTTTWPMGTCTGATEIIETGDDLDETIASDGTPDGYKLCASAADRLGNVGLSRASNWFGVDKVAPLVRIHGTTAATPALTGTVATGTAAGQVSATPNTTIYSMADPYPATHVWGLEAIDGRSGFHQGAALPAPYTDMYPASQTIIRTTVLGPDTVMGPNLLNQVLTDNYVRTATEWAFLGGLAHPGYYWYQGKVTDRAGNVGTMFTRNWLVDQSFAPTIGFLSYAQTFYAPGEDAAFVIFGEDDLEVIDATVTMDYPTAIGVLGIQHTQAVGARWDGLDPFDAGAFTTAVTGVTFTVPSVLGRYDFVCFGAGAPYPSCAIANAPTPVVAEFNTAPLLLGGFGDARNLLPVSATPTEFVDAGGNLSAAGASVSFNVLQWSDTTRAPWLDDLDNDGIQDLLTWRIFSPTGTTFAAEHMAPTSIKDTFFDAVALVVADGSTIITCGLFPAPELTDTGLNRFWTYTLAKPTASSTGSMKACFDASAGNQYHAVGILDNAALITAGIAP